MKTAEPLPEDNDVAEIDDIERFRARVANRLSPHALRSSAAEPFSSRIWGTTLADLSVLQFSTGTDLDVDIPEHLEYFDFVTARSGSAWVRSGVHDVEVLPGRTGVILQPDTRVEMRLRSGYNQLHLRIAPSVLLRTAEQLLGRDVGSRIEFLDARIDFTRSSNAWATALAGVADDGMRGWSASPHALIAQQWAEVFVTSVLTTLPHSLGPLFEAEVRRIPYRSMRVATEYIEAHLPDSLTVAEIAGAAGVSVRALQRGFREYHGDTPLGFIKRRRLAAVRRDLLDAGTAESVSDIAYRWGFTHLSRFAAAYQRKYGELPSSTLRTGGAALTRTAPPDAISG